MNKNAFEINSITFDIYSDSSVFGDGQHETTQFMLEMLQMQDIKGKRVLDIGTGTGILSVFAKKSGADHVMAIDISGAALEWARKNFKRNDVEIEVEINNLTQHLPEQADIIMANLPPAEQAENLKDVKKNLREGGVLIISWFNKVPLEDWNMDFEVVHHIEGREYDGYILNAKE